VGESKDFCCSLAFASHPLITDEAGIQGKGKIQLEIDGEYKHDKNEDEGITTKTIQLTSTLTCGITDPLDISIGVSVLRKRWSEFCLETRYNLHSSLRFDLLDVREF